MYVYHGVSYLHKDLSAKNSTHGGYKKCPILINMLVPINLIDQNGVEKCGLGDFMDHLMFVLNLWILFLICLDGSSNGRIAA